MSGKYLKQLTEKIQEIQIIDTHEHIMSQQEVLEEELHIFRVFENSYARLDFISAAMAPEVWQYDNPEDIWHVWKQFQDKVSLTCYFKNIVRALQDLYGLEGSRITEYNWKELSEKVITAYKRNDWYEYVLRNKANFQISFLDKYWKMEIFDFDPHLFRPVVRSNGLILGRKYCSPYPARKAAHTQIEDLAVKWNLNLDDLECYMAVIDTAVRIFKTKGTPAVKIGTAYERSLFFEDVSKDEAARIYAKNPNELTPVETKKLQDFMAHYIIQKATEEDLAVQIHTGILARNAAILANTNPEKLNNLFLSYPDTRFVLLHLAFPYTRQVLSLAKMFPNVYLDFCWAPMLSRKAAENALDEYLDLVPYNKLMWGGDAFRVEEAYGASCLAREVLASVLAERIETGDIDMEGALRISKAILHDNARDVFKLGLP